MSDRQDAGTPPRHEMDPIERMVNRVLVVGVGLAVALMAVGIVLSLLDGTGLPAHVVALGDLASRLGSFDPAAYLSLGLMVLIATPFVRVAGSIVAFARQHDRRYVLITAVVLAVMCLSVALGRA
ncbi:MAG TPA: DUF1634 domain-containing protein [Thermoleophilia bacterium]|nr:DUF1634 domain-containing protein [Thermoleophilia bacterium]